MTTDRVRLSGPGTGRGKFPKRFKPRPEILEMRKRGMTFQEIADHYGFTRERARQVLFKEKIIKEIGDA